LEGIGAPILVRLSPFTMSASSIPTTMFTLARDRYGNRVTNNNGFVTSVVGPTNQTFALSQPVWRDNGYFGRFVLFVRPFVTKTFPDRPSLSSRCLALLQPTVPRWKISALLKKPVFLVPSLSSCAIKVVTTLS
jgi:hypothetical protein